MRKRSEAVSAEATTTPATTTGLPIPSEVTSAPTPSPVNDVTAFLNHGTTPPAIRLSDGFERIVESTFIESSNVWPEYEALESALAVGENRGDYTTLMSAADNAEKNARRAFKLLATGKLDVSRYEMDVAPIRAAMRAKAVDALQVEKDKGLRNKQITDADTEAKLAELFPDEYRSQEVRARKVKEMVKSLEDLHAKWSSRSGTLQRMVGTMRR